VPLLSSAVQMWTLSVYRRVQQQQQAYPCVHAPTELAILVIAYAPVTHLLQMTSRFIVANHKHTVLLILSLPGAADIVVPLP
jgi:hypothetical protein